MSATGAKFTKFPLPDASFDVREPFTLVMAFTVRTGGTQRICHYRTLATTAVIIQLVFLSSGKLAFTRGSSSSTQAAATTTTTLPVDAPHVVVCQFDGTTDRMWVNGTEQTGGPSGGVGSGATSESWVGRNASGSSYMDGSVALFAHIQGLPDGESLSANPWQIFAKPDEEPDTVAAANSYTLNVGGAQMLISGRQVGMRVSRQLRAEPASLAIAPGTVGMRASRKLTVAPIALTLATSDVALLASRRLGVLPAAMAVTGGQVVGRVSRRLPVAPAAMIITGGQVSMLYAPKPEAGSYTLPVSAAAMALTCGNVGMRVARRLRVTPASLALAAGAVRTLVGRHLMVSPAGLQLASGPVTLRFSAKGEPFDITKIHPSRIVIFEGSGSRVTPFEGSGSRVTPFDSTGTRKVRFE